MAIYVGCTTATTPADGEEQRALALLHGEALAAGAFAGARLLYDEVMAALFARGELELLCWSAQGALRRWPMTSRDRVHYYQWSSPRRAANLRPASPWRACCNAIEGGTETIIGPAPHKASSPASRPVVACGCARLPRPAAARSAPAEEARPPAAPRRALTTEASRGRYSTAPWRAHRVASTATATFRCRLLHPRCAPHALRRLPGRRRAACAPGQRPAHQRRGRRPRRAAAAARRVPPRAAGLLRRTRMLVSRHCKELPSTSASSSSMPVEVLESSSYLPPWSMSLPPVPHGHLGRAPDRGGDRGGPPCPG